MGFQEGNWKSLGETVEKDALYGAQEWKPLTSDGEQLFDML